MVFYEKCCVITCYTPQTENLTYYHRLLNHQYVFLAAIGSPNNMIRVHAIGSLQVCLSHADSSMIHTHKINYSLSTVITDL